MLTPSIARCAPAVGNSALLAKPSTCATSSPASAMARSCRVERDGAQRPRLRAAPPGSARSRRSRPVARGEAAAHRSASTNAGTACPDARSSKATVTCAPIRNGGVRPVEQAPDHPQLVLLVELDVDEHERDVVVEAGEERLSQDRPAADHASATHGLEHVRRSLLPQCRQTRSTGIVNVPHRAQRATVSTCAARPPSTARTGRREPGPAASLAHGMTPASLSAPICSHVYPARAASPRCARRARAPVAARVDARRAAGERSAIGTTDRPRSTTSPR